MIVIVVEIKRANPDILHALIVNADRNILAHTDEKQMLAAYSGDLVDDLHITWKRDSIELKVPIIIAEKTEGNFIFAINTALLKKAKSELIINSVIKCVSVVLVGVLLSLWLSMRIVKPLNILSSYAQKLPSHDFSSDKRD